MALAREPAPLLRRTVALAVPRPLAKVLPQTAALSLVAMHVRVNRRVTDLQDLEQTQPAADLFGTELLTQKNLDQLPLARSELAVAARARSPAVGPFLSFAVSVRTVVLRAVALELATDRAAMAVSDASYLGVRIACLRSAPSVYLSAGVIW